MKIIYFCLLNFLYIEHACITSFFSHVRFFATLWTVACQAPLSMALSRREYWSGLPFPSPGDLPDPGIKPESPAGGCLPSEPAHCEFPRQNTKKRARVLLSGKMIEETEGVLCWYLLKQPFCLFAFL